MAYIGEHAVGEYKLSSGAYDFYADWYIDFKEELQGCDPDEILHQDNRRDVNVLKLALVIAAQKYEGTKIITEEDIRASIKIMDYTLGRASKDVMRASLNPENIVSQKLLNIIEKAGKQGILKSKILQNHSKLFNNKQLNDLLENLFYTDAIYVHNADNGSIKNEFTGKREKYVFKKRFDG